MTIQHVDVLIIGGGLSGIGAAYFLQKKCPSKSYLLLEGRERLGGTWDLFRYPGIRSDSDMFTLGYSFKPWKEREAIAPGSSIKKYITDTATENGIDKNIRFNSWVETASWDTTTALWTLTTKAGEQYTCSFLYVCAGYYNYDAGYTPEFKGVDDFKGTLIHPQHWPENLDYKGKHVTVIGSGATAVTLVPSLAQDASHVTMLQRSPTYIFTRPSTDELANTMSKYLPSKLSYDLTRWKNVLRGILVYRMSRKNPEKLKALLLGGVRANLGPDYDVDKHFTPKYNPWDQRLCLVPDADLFKVINSGKASIATDEIDTFTADGIKLKSGDSIKTDIIVTATGLDLVMLGNMKVSVDGNEIKSGDHTMYKGMMFNDVPNMIVVSGYTNASWTLKADLTGEYFCRLLKYMDDNRKKVFVPHLDKKEDPEGAWTNLSSGYFQRAQGKLPKLVIISMENARQLCW